MLLAAVAVCLLSSAPQAADFFPLESGMSWTYEVTGDMVGSYQVKVGAPAPVGDRSIPEVTVISQGKVSQHVFYDVSDTGVKVLAYDPKKPLEDPQPVFTIGEKPTHWDFVGPSPYEGDKGAILHIVGDAKMVGTREVLGQKRECLEVKTESKIGFSESTATVFKQTSIYAKGVGLAEVQEVTQFGRKVVKKKTTLVKFQNGEAGQ